MAKTTAIPFGIVLLVLVSVSAASTESEIELMPIMHVSPKPDHPKAEMSIVYKATVCNDKLYHGKMLLARVNLPYGWNPTHGEVAKLEESTNKVCNSQDCAKIHCSNYNNEILSSHYCNFSYTAGLGDIYLRVTAGRAPNIAWTVVTEFLDMSEWKPPTSLVTPIKYRGFPETVTVSEVTTLRQIVMSNTQMNVVTLGDKEMYWHFCPNDQTGDRYNIKITVTGVDTKSAMASYACLPSELPCGVGSSSHYDPSGTALNSIVLSTGSVQLTEIHLFVIGWGDHGYNNTFIVSATTETMV